MLAKSGSPHRNIQLFVTVTISAPLLYAPTSVSNPIQTMHHLRRSAGMPMSRLPFLCYRAFCLEPLSSLSPIQFILFFIVSHLLSSRVLLFSSSSIVPLLVPPPPSCAPLCVENSGYFLTLFNLLPFSSSSLSLYLLESVFAIYRSPGYPLLGSLRPLSREIIIVILTTPAHSQNKEARTKNELDCMY